MNADELWKTYVESFDRMVWARMGLRKNLDAEVYHLIRQSLDDPGERPAALHFVAGLPEEKARPLFVDILEIAVYSNGLTELATSVLLSYPQEWAVNQLVQRCVSCGESGDLL